MYFFQLLVLVFCVSCSTLKEKGDSSASKPQNATANDITLFESAFQDMGKGEYRAVIPIFEQLAKKYRGQDLEWPALYNLAGAYKEVGQCDRAETIYRQLIVKAGKQPHLKSRIYLSLAYAYECLGQADKTLIALKEGEQYINHLTEEIRLIEYPARLSMAYLRMNEDKTGLKIQKQMYQNLLSMKRTFRISSAADENFSRYFYIIGRSHVRSDRVQLRQFLKMLFYHQIYLTQSLLLSAGKWSALAEKELGDLYRKLWFELGKQKDKTIYEGQIKKILNQLKTVVRSSKNKKMQNIYSGLRKKTLLYLQK